MISLNDFIAVVGFIIGVLTSFAGFLAWYSSSVKKSYAAERDFNHLRRNYEQLSANQGVMMSNMKEIDDSLKDIKDMLKDMSHNR